MTWVLEVVWVGRDAPGRGHGLEAQWCELNKCLGVVEHEVLWSRRREVRQGGSLPGDLPNPGIKPEAPALQVDSLPAELPRNPNTKC